MKPIALNRFCFLLFFLFVFAAVDAQTPKPFSHRLDSLAKISRKIMPELTRLTKKNAKIKIEDETADDRKDSLQNLWASIAYEVLDSFGNGGYTKAQLVDAIGKPDPDFLKIIVDTTAIAKKKYWTESVAIGPLFNSGIKIKNAKLQTGDQWIRYVVNSSENRYMAYFYVRIQKGRIMGYREEIFSLEF